MLCCFSSWLDILRHKRYVWTGLDQFYLADLNFFQSCPKWRCIEKVPAGLARDWEYDNAQEVRQASESLSLHVQLSKPKHVFGDRHETEPPYSPGDWEDSNSV